MIADAYCINSWLTQVFGLVNTSGRKDFEVFWESPWTEEHVQDAPKKRKLEAQQRSMAVRSYIRASSMQQDQHDVGKFIETVDQLTHWEVIATRARCSCFRTLQKQIDQVICRTATTPRTISRPCRAWCRVLSARRSEASLPP